MTAWPGKGGKTRLVPVHPELHGALSSALAYGDISQGRIVEAHTTTAWRWVKTAVKRAASWARWLGHSSIQTTLIYLELVPDPTGSLALVP